MLSIRNVSEAEMLEAAVLSEKETRKFVRSWKPFKEDVSLTSDLRSVCSAYEGVELSSEMREAVYQLRQLICDGKSSKLSVLSLLPLGELKRYRLLQHFHMYKEQMKLSSLRVVGKDRRGSFAVCDEIWRVRFLQELCECYEGCKSKKAAKQMFLDRIIADITKEEMRCHDKILNMSLLSLCDNKVATLY